MGFSVFAVGSAATNAGGDLTVSPPAGDLEGKLLLLIAGCSITGSVSVTTSPTGYTLLSQADTDECPFVWGKIGTSSESSVDVDFNAGGNCGWIVAIESDDGWPDIDSVLEGVSNSAPANSSSELEYAAHTVIANGNCIIQVAHGASNMSGSSVSGVGVTTDWTAAGQGWRNLAGGIVMAAQMQDAASQIGTDPGANTVTVTGLSDAIGRDALTLELIPDRPAYPNLIGAFGQRRRALKAF